MSLWDAPTPKVYLHAHVVCDRCEKKQDFDIAIEGRVLDDIHLPDGWRAESGYGFKETICSNCIAHNDAWAKRIYEPKPKRKRK